MSVLLLTLFLGVGKATKRAERENGKRLKEAHLSLPSFVFADQTYSIVAICIFFVFGFVFWNLPVIRCVKL